MNQVMFVGEPFQLNKSAVITVPITFVKSGQVKVGTSYRVTLEEVETDSQRDVIP